MNDETLLQDLIALWKRRRAGGDDVAPTELCRDRPDLLAELQRRLAALNDLGATVQLSADSPSKTLPPARAAATPNAIVPGYVLIKELGRGGMGVVYLARQEGLGRRVALKMILAGAHAGSADLGRFRTEAEAIARLQHPNIVQVFEIGEHQGLPYFSLEYCAGGALESRLQGTPLAPVAAAELIEALALAMQAAHDQDILHRDLKPANVLLTADGTPKITDFGLAKKIGEAGQTASGAVMGTPSYMAPEQAGGLSHAIGPRTDVYALGAILYECLTGRPPFKAATALDTIMQVANDEPVPPRQLQSATPRDLETVCLKCLHKEPRKRYDSAQALADDLRRFLNDEPVRARAVGRLERGWRWCRRNRALAGALLAVTFALVAGTVVSALFAVRSEREAGRAREAAAVARDNLEQLQEEKRRNLDLLYPKAIHEAHLEWQANGAARARQILAEADESRRGWEWHYLNAVFEGNSVALRGHSAAVRAALLSPDGLRAVTASADGTVRVWSAVGGVEQQTFNHQAYRLALSADGQRLALADEAGVRLIDAATGQETAFLREGVAAGLGFAGDGRRLIVVWLNGDVRSYSVPLGEKEPSQVRIALDGLTRQRLGLGQGVVVSADGRRVAQGFLGGQVRVWDAATGDKLLDVVAHFRPGGQAAFSPDGKRLASPGGDGSVRVWELATKQTVLVLRGHRSKVHCVAFSPDGSRLITASQDTTVRLWDAATGEALLVLRGHNYDVLSVAFGGSDRAVSFAVNPDNVPRVWDVRERVIHAEHVRDYARRTGLGEQRREGNQEVLTFFGQVSAAGAVAFDPTGRFLASSALGDEEADHQVTLWHLSGPEGRREAQRLKVRRGRVHRLAFSPDGRFLAVGSGGLQVPQPAELTLFEVATGRELWGYRDGPNCMHLRPVFSADGRTLAAMAGLYDKQATLLAWDADTGKVRYARPQTGPCLRCSFSPDGSRLVTAGAAANLVYFFVHDAATGVERTRWPAPVGGLTDVVCGAGNVVAASDVNGAISLWDLDSGRMIREVQGYGVKVQTMTFSPDGSRLLAAALDFTARVFHVETGAPLLTLRGHSDNILDLAWSDDGSRIATAGQDGAVKLWESPIQTTPRTDDWPLVFRADFEGDAHEKDWQADLGSWEVRQGVLCGRQTLFDDRRGLRYPIAVLRLTRATLPRTAEVRFGYRAARPLVVTATLASGRGNLIFSALLAGSERPFGRPCTALMQFTEGMRMSAADVRRPYAMEPGRWHKVRLLREADRLRVFVDGVERLAERLPQVDLPHLSIGGSWSNAGDEVEFDGLEVRAPAEAIREDVLRRQAHDLFGKLHLRAEVLQRMLAQGELSLQDRTTVERIVAEFVESPSRLSAAARTQAGQRGASQAEYALALRQAETAQRAAPTNNDFLTVLGLAQYRAGQAQSAVNTLTAAVSTTRRERGAATPAQVGFLALALHRLDKRADARDQLQRLRDLMRCDCWSAEEDARALLAEAEEVCQVPPEAGDVEAIKSVFARGDQDGWLHRRLAPYLKMFAADATDIDGRSEKAEPHDVTLTRPTVEAVRRRVFLPPPLPTDFWAISYEDMRVALKGDEAELTLRSTFRFGGDYAAFGLRYQFVRTPTGWRVRASRSWPLVEKLGGTTTVFDADFWARRDGEVERLKADPLALARACQSGRRWTEMYEATRRATQSKDASAEAWLLRCEAALKLGKIEDALLACRTAEAKDARAELPWYMSRLRQHLRADGTLAVALDGDGRRVLSAGLDGVGRLWDAATGKELRRFPGAEGVLSGAELSPDGRVAALGGKDVRFWDVETGKLLHVCAGHTERVYRVAFSPDGTQLVSASADDTARVWDTTGQERVRLRGHGGDVLGAVFSPDGRYLATASHDRTARLWDATTGAQLRVFTGHANVLTRVAFSADGTRLVTTSFDKTVRVWDVESGREVLKIGDREANFEAALFSPDGKRIAAAETRGWVFVYDGTTGKLLTRLRHTEAGLHGLAFRRDGKILAASGADGVFLWDVSLENDVELRR